MEYRSTSDFIKWCDSTGVRAVSHLQVGDTGDDRKADVWLAKDTDGIFKIYKELLNYASEVGHYLNEDKIFEKLSDTPWTPKYHGIQDVFEVQYMRRSFMPGQNLADYCGKERFTCSDSLAILSEITRALLHFISKGMYFLDLRPDNILVTRDTVGFPDLGLCRFSDDGLMDWVLVGHPRYTAPEIALHKTATEKSIVFMLGILGQELLSGEHPYDQYHNDEPTTEWKPSVFRYLNPMIEGVSRRRDDVIKENILISMLERDPDKRPTLKKCLESFGECRMPVRRSGYPTPHQKSNSVLFPARMGIPHKGHIEYMTRILELGYKLIISVQRSYTITDRDPIPKWLVRKMVAQSLRDQGFSDDSYTIYLCPFYRTVPEMAMHFSMLPGRSDIVAVASNNAGIQELFSGYDLISQRDVLGYEGEEFEPRSWGEIIRGSVKLSDYATFKKYVASGVESILIFDEIKEMYGMPPIEFVPGRVYAELHDRAGGLVARCGVPKYIAPDEYLVKSVGGKILSHYDKHTRAFMKDIGEVSISYDDTDFDGTDETIHYEVVH